MISPEEKMRILLVVEEAIKTARVGSGLYIHTEDDKALMRIWRSLWLATDLVSAELHVCRSKLPEPLVEVERREPEALSGTLDAEIERLHAYNKRLRTELRRMVEMFPDADAQHPEQQPDIDAFLGEGRKPVRSLASVMVPSARDPEQQPIAGDSND